MTKQFLFKTCELLHTTHHQPIACFQKNGNLERVFCSYEGYAPIFRSIAQRAGEENLSIVTGIAGLYGVVHIYNLKMVLIVGPFINKKLDNTLFDSLIHEYGFPWQERDSLKQFLLSLPRRSLNRFLSFLALLNYLFNKKEISITDYFKDLPSELQKEVGSKHAQTILLENEFSHNTYNIEQQLLSYVSAGDVAGLSSFFETIAKTQPFTEGKVADDTLRQSKNIFIGLICMVGKVGAIRGNLDIEQTYQLIDLYTQECERCTSVYTINQLRYTAIMDFTQRVAEQKHPQAYSSDVYKALQFIKTHTNSLIGVPDVLDHVNRCRSAFMNQFRKETGETIGRCIVMSKLQEAKLLLAYSDRSLAEISFFFFFSSQSYFQNLFKKEFGVTPLEYRRKHHRE